MDVQVLNPPTPAQSSVPTIMKLPSHIPALDGIRGLAIIMVLCFHFLLVSGSGIGVRLIQHTWGFGWSGVDLFFVLSGFLITGILLDAKSDQHYFRNFYARRTVRIFPLYFAFLLVFMHIFPAVIPNFNAHFGVPPMGKWAYWFYVYNILQPPHNPATFSSSLGVVWSLNIEEQFYLIWPTIVLFCKPKTLLKICGFLFVAAMVCRLILVGMHEREIVTQQWTCCRMDGLAVGAAIAICARSFDLRIFVKPALLTLISVPILLLAASFVLGTLPMNPGFRVLGFSVLALMFGSLLLLTITLGPANPLAWFFSLPIMRMFGRYSYAMYLFNQPIRYTLTTWVFDPDKKIFFHSKVPGQLLFFLVATVLTTGLAWLSWNLFEKHCLKLKKFFPLEAHHAKVKVAG